MTATDTEPDTAAGDDIIALAEEATGLTRDELRAIGEAQGAVLKVCSGAVGRELAAHRPAAEQAIAGAETALREAQEALEGPQAVVDALQAQLDECRRLAGEIQAVSEDDPLSVRIRARAERAAVEQEAEAIEGRLRQAIRVTDPLVVAVADAERKHRAARGVLGRLDEAIQFPMFSSLGKGTRAYREWLRQSGAWYGDKSREAEALVIGHLKATGLGDRLQRDAIAAYCAGDATARSVAGNVKHFGDGSTLTQTADGLAIVTHGQATPEALSTAAPVNTVPGPSAADVMTGARNGFGWPVQPPQSVTKAAGRQQPVVPEDITRLMVWASR